MIQIEIELPNYNRFLHTVHSPYPDRTQLPTTARAVLCVFILYIPNTHLVPSICSWDPISKYINEQYEKFLKEEVNIARKKRIPDTRVHCCLYFISPTGHS